MLTAAVKAKSTDTIRVWFVPVLARGKLHLELLPDDFPGETERGAEILVAKVRADGRTGGQMDGRTDAAQPWLCAAPRLRKPRNKFKATIRTSLSQTGANSALNLKFDRICCTSMLRLRNPTHVRPNRSRA